jgi:hypothetical protein
MHFWREQEGHALLHWRNTSHGIVTTTYVAEEVTLQNVKYNIKAVRRSIRLWYRVFGSINTIKCVLNLTAHVSKPLDIYRWLAFRRFISLKCLWII